MADFVVCLLLYKNCTVLTAGLEQQNVYSCGKSITSYDLSGKRVGWHLSDSSMLGIATTGGQSNNSHFIHRLLAFYSSGVSKLKILMQYGQGIVLI